MRRTGRCAGAVAVAAVALLLTGCQTRTSWRNELVTIDRAGTGGVHGYAYGPVFSPDGTKIAFVAQSGSLVPQITLPSAITDVYVRDLVAGTTTLVSMSGDGRSGGDGPSWDPVFSPDGTKVAFSSQASNLGPADGNGGDDVYVRDLAGGATSLVSHDGNPDGQGAGDSTSGNPAFSPDGTAIAYESRASNLGPTDDNGLTDVYLYDVASRTNSLVSANDAGTGSGTGRSYGPVFGPDGSSLAFGSTAGDLGVPDANGVDDIYLRDLATGGTTIISTTPAGAPGDDLSFSPVFSPTGHRVAFFSYATDLTSHGGPPRVLDIYVRDLRRRTTSLVTVSAQGTRTGGAASEEEPVFSPDGTKLVFASDGDDFGPTDRPHTRPGGMPERDVYVRDLTRRRTALVSVNAGGGANGNGSSFHPSFGPDSATVVFESTADDLGPVDSDRSGPYNDADIYARDLARGTTTLVSARPDGRDSANDLSRGPVAGPRGRVAYTSWASDLGPIPTGPEDLWVARRTRGGPDAADAADAAGD